VASRKPPRPAAPTADLVRQLRAVAVRERVGSGEAKASLERLARRTLPDR
jgi:hypothetical protein